MVSDSTPQAGTTILPAMSFTPVEPRLDAIVMLRRNSASSRSSSHTSSATPTNNSSPRSSANTRFTPGPQSGAGSNSPPLTPVPSSLLQPVDEEPNTPSSTVVEFGDLTKGSIPSAAELVENIHRTFSQSHVTRSESRSSSKAPGTREGRETRDQSRSRGSGLPSASVPRERSQSIPRAKDPKSAATEKGLAEDRINRFLLSMAQQAAQTSESELLQENQSLHQRIAALQRTERDLLAENQDLTRKFTALKHHHDRRARQWSEGLRRKETEYEARIQEMSEQLLGLASTHPQKVPTVLSNEEISAWFDDQDAAWNNWSSEFGHMDPGRLSNGLHPLQLQELCDDVKGFVRMTDTGTLPAELVSGGKEAIHTLLNGMLANFVCAETLASPLWVFAATSLGTLESPGIVPAKPLPGLPAVGFRMDMNSFSDVAPLRPGANPTPRSPQFPPPLITSMMPPLGGSASLLGLPVKSDMERLVHMLTDAQDEGVRVAAHQWRAQMMRLFADGGFSLKDVAAAGRNESRRTFVESRLNYARKLKERFLGGAARFLLQDQDSSGIEKLERVLMDMIDDALRFSYRLWSRVTPLRLHGWKDLGGKAFGCSTQLVTLCHAQAPATCCKHHERSKDKQAGSPAANHGDRSVIMVVQPGVVTDNADLSASKDGSGGNGVALVWLRARVMVAGPIGPESSAPAPAGVGSQPSPRSDSNSVKGPSTTALTGPTPKPDTPKSFEVLPASSYTTSIDAAE